jgi:hypothetical protein
MSDIVVENPYKFYLMILVVGLFMAFTSGFVVGAQGKFQAPVQTPAPQVISACPTPANFDLTKHDQEVLQGCYKLVSDSVISLREQALKTEGVVTTAMVDISKVCHGKQIVVATPGAADVLDLQKKRQTH